MQALLIAICFTHQGMLVNPSSEMCSSTGPLPGGQNSP